jgi:hypothetical protein
LIWVNSPTWTFLEDGTNRSREWNNRRDAEALIVGGDEWIAKPKAQTAKGSAAKVV